MQSFETIEAVTTLLKNATNLQKMNTLLLHTLVRNVKDNTTRTKLLSLMTKYHVDILSKIKDISDNLAPTLDTLPEEIQEISTLYYSLDEYNKVKALKMIEELNKTEFIPQNLGFCPRCGSFFSKTSKCKKVRIILGNQPFGTTYICKEISKNE